VTGFELLGRSGPNAERERGPPPKAIRTTHALEKEQREDIFLKTVSRARAIRFMAPAVLTPRQIGNHGGRIYRVVILILAACLSAEK